MGVRHEGISMLLIQQFVFFSFFVRSICIFMFFELVQPYTINSAKVIFLKPRPQSRPFKGSGNICLTCDRILQEPFHFCCLSCKVHFLCPNLVICNSFMKVPVDDVYHVDMTR